MREINVSEIAARINESNRQQNIEDIERMVSEEFNGKTISIEELPQELMMMVAKLTGEVRAQQSEFTIELLQSVVEELQENEKAQG